MENIHKRLGMQDEQISARWEMYHPDRYVVAVGKGNNGNNTTLDEEIDLDLVRYMAVYSQYMVS